MKQHAMFLIIRMKASTFKNTLFILMICRLTATANLLTGLTATQSGMWGDFEASYCNDGYVNGNFCHMNNDPAPYDWWEVKFSSA